MSDREREAENDPQVMLERVGPKMSARKVRLFAAACCWKSARLLGPDYWWALRVAELYADGYFPPEAMTNVMVWTFRHHLRDIEFDSPRHYALLSLHAALYTPEAQKFYCSESDVSALHPQLLPYAPEALERPWDYALCACIHSAAAAAKSARRDGEGGTPDDLIERESKNQVAVLRAITGEGVPEDDLDAVSKAGRMVPALRVHAARLYAGPAYGPLSAYESPEGLSFSPFSPDWEIAFRLMPHSVRIGEIWAKLDEQIVTGVVRKGSWLLDRLLGFE